MYDEYKKKRKHKNHNFLYKFRIQRWEKIIWNEELNCVQERIDHKYSSLAGLRYRERKKNNNADWRASFLCGSGCAKFTAAHGWPEREIKKIVIHVEH